MYAPTWPTLPPGLLLSTRVAEGVGVDLARAAGLYEYARDAVFDGLTLLGLRRGDAVLAPAYTCEAVLAPLVSHGLRILYYGLEPDMTPRVEDLRLGWGSAKALYLIDYFGISTPSPAIIEEARSHGLLILRDMAHRLYGLPGEPPPEGDMAVWSLRKFFPVPDGGVLWVRSPGTESLRPAPPSPARIGRVGWLIAKNLAVRTGVGRAGRAARGTRGALDGVNWRLSGRSISRWSRFLMRRSAPAAIHRDRRRNYRILEERLNTLRPDVRPVFARLPDGATPYAFPLLVERRDALRAALLQAGVMSEATFCNCPFLPPGAEEIRPGVTAQASALADRVLCLPIVQELGPSAMGRIADRIQAWHP